MDSKVPSALNMQTRDIKMTNQISRTEVIFLFHIAEMNQKLSMGHGAEDRNVFQNESRRTQLELALMKSRQALCEMKYQCETRLLGKAHEKRLKTPTELLNNVRIKQSLCSLPLSLDCQDLKYPHMIWFCSRRP